MSTTVESLLGIMSLRLKMFEDGTIKPAAMIVSTLSTLVARLRDLDSTEEIDISILDRDPLFVQYVRSSTGEILAEIDETKNI